MGAFLIISGGDVPELTGNASAADVLLDKTFYNTDPETKLTGAYNPEKFINLTNVIPSPPTISVSTAVAPI